MPYVVRRGTNGSSTAIRGAIGPVEPSSAWGAIGGPRKVPGPPSRAALRRSWFDRAMIAMVAVAFGTPVILGFLGRHQYRAEHAYGEPTAWTACQEVVRSHLHAPATARFTGPTLSPGAAPDETQVISAAVEAQRSDGAWRRSRFVCEANLVGTDWLAYVVFASE
jgi:hypothetical protein